MILIGSSACRTDLFLQTCLLTLALLLPCQASAEIHKWVDGSGKTHYTQFPPAGFESEIVREAPSPAAPPKPPASEPQAPPEETQKDPDRGPATAEREKKVADIKRLNCDAATGNLATLEDKSQRRYMTAGGELLRPSDEERQKLIDQAKEQIKEYCSK